MRPLDEKETTMVFEKLFKFTGPNLKHLLERPSAEGPTRSPAATASASTRTASSTPPSRSSAVPPPSPARASPGSAPPSASSPTAEPSTSPNSVPKSALTRITENTKSGDGVVVMSMADVPLGFGVAARGAQDCRKADTNVVVVLHQSDAGEYLCKEEELM
uniref:Uncharacterized protein n=1 Tax=Avena sativa TaxID=4498 RepID=A0ACD5ZS22_AVESA